MRATHSHYRFALLAHSRCSLSPIIGEHDVDSLGLPFSQTGQSSSRHIAQCYAQWLFQLNLSLVYALCCFFFGFSCVLSFILRARLVNKHTRRTHETTATVTPMTRNQTALTSYNAPLLPLLSHTASVYLVRIALVIVSYSKRMDVYSVVLTIYRIFIFISFRSCIGA